MNEWYPLVNKYKLEHNLTWPQFALQLEVNERGLRRKDSPPSPKIIAKLREFFHDTPLPATLQVQPTIFSNEPYPKLIDKAISLGNAIDKQEKIMPKESEQSPQNGARKEGRSVLSEDEAGRLLILHEYLRDPIHQDIWITAFERELIDTADPMLTRCQADFK